MGTADVFFIGFDHYNCKEELWSKVFTSDNAWKSLRDQFAIDNQSGFDEIMAIEPQQLLRKLSGREVWGKYANHFLSYRQNNTHYCHYWLPHEFSPSEWKEIFKRFQSSIPAEEACPEHQKKYLPAAQKVSAYLDSVLTYCQSPCPEDEKAWLSAGMYTLICFFVQNGKRCKPQYYEPPAPYTLSDLQEAMQKKQQRISGSTKGNEADRACPGKIPPVVDAPPLPFDLFALIHQRFQQPLDRQEESLFREMAQDFRQSAAAAPRRTIITPAQIHRRLLPYSEIRDIRHMDADNGTSAESAPVSQTFSINDTLLSVNDQYFLRHKLSHIPYEACDEAWVLTYRANCFEDDTSCQFAVLGPVESERPHRCVPETVGFTDTARELPGTAASETLCLRIRIDEYGRQKDVLEDSLLNAYGIGSLPQEHVPQPAVRSAAARFRPDDLNCQFFVEEGMRELELVHSRNEATGERRLSLAIPCPCTLLVFRNALTPLSAKEVDLWRLTHSENVQRMTDLMREGAYRGEAQMCFQYGAYLRQRLERPDTAELMLRKAAKQGIPGAAYELAALLKELGSPEALAEAQMLIEDLWKQGYRTYGAHTPIRELFPENPL